jgi:2-oxoisovalerate dehydrogenase E1 component alpha subunit
MIAQCAGNKNDPASGRQMPVHYSAKSLNIHCVSSPLATQIPQAAGAGYAFRISGEDKIAVTFFGEGTTSEGDFHSAMNFGATLNCQTLFICRNNKYAISTHMSD